MTAADRKYQHILRAVYARPWAIEQDFLFGVILPILEFRAAGGVLTDEEITARVGAAQNGPRKGGRQSGAVAVIPVYGPISARQNMMSASSGGTSIEQLTADFRGAMADPQVDGIVLEIDSPGGTIDGVAELAAEIRDARGGKPVVAHANSMAASAAYWIAAACDEIAVTPSGSVGSIGIFGAHQDLSKAAEMEGVKTTLISAGKYKTEANPWEPLSDDARKNLQDQIDQFYGMFVTDVARGRGVPVDTVRKGYGEGRVVLAKQALAQGMVDRIETLDATIRRVARMAIGGRDAISASRVALVFHADAMCPACAHQSTCTCTTCSCSEQMHPKNKMQPMPKMPAGPTDTCPDCAHQADCACTTCSCDNAIHTNASASALVSGQAFSDRLALVSAQAEGLLAHARERADMRAKQGRGLPASDLDGLRKVAGSLLSLAGEPDPETEPEPEPIPAWTKAAANRLALARAEYGI